jgi:HK97 family phage prohead protease
MDRETYAATYELEGDTLSGVVHVFGTRTAREGVLHEYAPTAFGRSKPMAFYAHDTAKPLARPEIEIVDGKLHYKMTLGHQSYAEDLRQNVATGLMTEMSFGVNPIKWKDTRTPEGTVRLFTSADLFDISPVVRGAFTGTKALLHSADSPETARSQAVKARHRARKGKHQ